MTTPASKGDGHQKAESRIETLGRTPPLTSRVAAAIAAEITEGRLKPGDRLPSEQSLADRFGVGRNVVREAIAQMRSDGIVRSRQGVGMFVVSSEPTTMLRINADLLTDRTVFRNIFELRAILEIRAAALAARRADPSRVKTLASALDRMRNATNWAEDGVSADLDFHAAVAEAGGNPYITMMVRFLSGHMRQSIMFMRYNQSDIDGSMVATNIAEHTAIYVAIVERSAGRAQSAMRDHISNAAQRLGYILEREVLVEPDDHTSHS